MDILYSHSMVTARYQYIWRATDDVESGDDQDLLYPYAHDAEQLYDLYRDPNQKKNLIHDVRLSTVIHEFEAAMREYIEVCFTLVDCLAFMFVC